MSDALCGPSNPLQSFRKQTNLDRTLQQDRLANRQGPSQGFRSHDPRAGSLDAELHAFEHQQPHFPVVQPEPQFFQHHQQPPQLSQNGGWAADFQKLQISGLASRSSGPVPVSQFRTEAPLIKSQNGVGVGGWHQEFLRQSGSSTPVGIAKGKEVVRNGYAGQSQQNGYGLDMGMYGVQNTMNGYQPYQPTQMHQPIVQSGQEWKHMQGEQWEQFSDAQFDAAFQDAFLQEAAALQQQEHSPVLGARELGHEDGLGKSEVRIGSDAIHYTEMRDRTHDQDVKDADELARTAGQLLNLVKDETNQKFQNSQFLNLMRQLRDREVEVQNNEMVQKSTSASASILDAARQVEVTGGNVEQHQDFESIGPTEKDYSFAFPDMDDVYAPTNSDADAGQYSSSLPKNNNRFFGSWDYPVVNAGGRVEGLRPSSVPPTATSRDEYGTGSDEFPASQMQALHPGGKLYPHSPEVNQAVMAGGISAEDFETGAAEESGVLSQRFGQQS